MSDNANLRDEIFKSINLLLEATEHIYACAEGGNYRDLVVTASDINIILDMISNVIENNSDFNKGNFSLFVKNSKDSLDNILNHTKTRSNNLLNKIQFELFPLFQEMYQNFYFWNYAYPDKEKMEFYYENEMIPLGINAYIENAIATDNYKYELSVIVVGYNKLEYTKLCVESLLKYLPVDLNYELILVNHGSSDGTKEYFESLSPTKQLDFKYNGGAGFIVTRVVEGKYTLNISNDVLITENAIRNMLECIKSDEDIAFVVPSTPNVSNYQTVRGEYSNMEDMYKFSKRNNICDPFRWEQRIRLCNPVSMYPSFVRSSSKGIGAAYYFAENLNTFPDDALSLRLRRNGYKLMLAKDSYCYHYGSVTLKDEISEIQAKDNIDFYLEGRKKFLGTFGIDPWGTGFCYSLDLFEKIQCDNAGKTNILGINCGLGSNPLKIKEQIKEMVHNLDVNIYNMTDDKIYLDDLRHASNEVIYVDDKIELLEKIKEMDFDFIIIENDFKNKEYDQKFVADLSLRLNNQGKLIMPSRNVKLSNQVRNYFSHFEKNQEWLILTK